MLILAELRERKDSLIIFCCRPERAVKEYVVLKWVGLLWDLGIWTAQGGKTGVLKLPAGSRIDEMNCSSFCHTIGNLYSFW